MARMRFSVPDDVKRAFDREFAGEYKSRVIARLMMQAVEERNLQRTRASAIDAVLKRRRACKPITLKQFRAARTTGRP